MQVEFLIVLSSCSILTLSEIVDKACTTNGKFDGRAVMCANIYPDIACQALYGPPPTIGSEYDRSPACYTTNSSSIDHELKSLSSEICPRQCGYCCQSPEYNCQNSLRPRVACNQVTQRMCRNPVWIEILVEDCPNMCGFCLRGCVDNVPDCAIDKTICRRVGMEDFVKENCRRTCGYCKTSNINEINSFAITSAPSSAKPKGKCDHYRPDSGPNCASWALNGFCEDDFFSIQFRRKSCATTCKMC